MNNIIFMKLSRLVHDIKYNRNNLFLFLLYLILLVVITYYQLKYVFMPVLLELSTINDSTKAAISLFQQYIWIIYLMVPLFLIVRVTFVSVSLYIGGLIYLDNRYCFLEYWSVAIKAQSYFVLISLIMCIINCSMGGLISYVVYEHTSLVLLFGIDKFNNSLSLVEMPLMMLNIIELLYCFYLSFFVSKRININFKDSLNTVFWGYGVSFIFVMLLTAFILFLSAQ